MYQYMYSHYYYPCHGRFCDYNRRHWRRRRRHWDTHYYPYRRIDWGRHRYYDYW
jgi:hypothetical protein